MTGNSYTANRVGQNLSTFARRWVKYQQSKLFGQFDSTMGKLNQTLGNNLPDNSSKKCELGKFYATFVNYWPIIETVDI